MRDATPPKPRTPPRTTSAKKSGPSRKPKALKAVTVGRAGKRARKSLTTEDKQVVDPNIDKDDKGSGVGGKDAELDFENEITTPSVIGNGASSELSDPWDTDACARSDEYDLGERVKTPGASDHELSDPWDTDACARSDEYDLGERVKTPGASDHGASRSAGYFCGRDTPAKYNGKDKVRTPDGVPAGSPVLSDPQGSAGARKRNSRVIQAASTGYGRKRMKTEPTEDEVEDRSNNFGHSDQLSEVANVEASLDIKHAIIVPNVTHMFIYLGSPFSQIQFMVSIVPDSELEKYLFGDVQYYPWYKIQSLWQLVEPIPLKTLIEVYGYEGAPKRDVDVSPELLVACPLASMQKLF
ncbi:hypothetical protein L873DRAFT_1436395 [Choiromyces venosus 120613-1]|uniref:Uncharacterized protein n=1 Tax=Choiromyces venosus 120613-1 TaxID=1336337 RepID=A0A3N4J809_9PEZI|nr:hypothetical protein L873DRAFT_1436395 [Choiromyces venosus 120613-1]